MSRCLASLLALTLLLVSGPGWAGLFCGCGPAPKSACCCCEETAEAAGATPSGPAIEGRACDRVEVGKADVGPSAGAVEVSAPAPTLGSVTLVMAPPVVRVAMVAAPRHAPVASADPPYLRVRSLRC